MLPYADELLNCIQAHRLHSGFPRGVPTFWSLNRPGRNSTIDLTLTNAPECMLKCHLHHKHYGSDHRGAYSEWKVSPALNPEPKPQKAYERTKWDAVGQTIQRSLSARPELASEALLDQAVESLITATTAVIEKHPP